MACLHTAFSTEFDVHRFAQMSNQPPQSYELRIKGVVCAECGMPMKFPEGIPKIKMLPTRYNDSSPTTSVP